MEKIEFCKGGGCTAKLGPDVLKRVLSRLPEQRRDPDLLVGFDTNDDAAVYRVGPHTAIVQTLDFFPPMVDDPYTFGQIAAANALSDVWAMGGRPVTALNIVCFPQSWDLNILGQIMQGGAEKVAEAGAMLCGGHSIADADVKYGLSVTGLIDPDRVLTNVGVRPGDRLLLSKPLGTGIVCTAGRVHSASKESMDAAIRSMTTLNKYAAEVLSHYEVHACTDVTGFSLLGHLSEMLGMDAGKKVRTDQASDRPGQSLAAPGSDPEDAADHDLMPDGAAAGAAESGIADAARTCGAIVHWMAVPRLPGVQGYVEDDFFITANGQRNRNHVGDRVDFADAPFWVQELLFDPQTSGGLLAAIPSDQAEGALAAMKKLGLPCSLIGEVTDQTEKILVRA